jgi:preprotein translocase subunit SecE
MDRDKSKAGMTAEAGAESNETARPADETPRTPPTAPSAARAAPGAGLPLRVIKPGQGIHVRWGTAMGAGLLALAGAHFIWLQLPAFDFGAYQFYVRTLVPVVLLLAVAYLIFWAVGRSPKTVDFFIATEGEMKKVNWSTRKEVWGATRVVIVTVMALAIILCVVDVVFMLFFTQIGVLRFDIIHRFLGGGNT